jgi:hypothetical protein
MSACIRSLYSSDQRAPGFTLALLCGCGRGAVLLSLGDFRAPTFSLSVTRDVGLEDEFELFMQLLGTYFNFVTLLALSCPGGSRVDKRNEGHMTKAATNEELILTHLLPFQHRTRSWMERVATSRSVCKLVLPQGTFLP